MNRVTVVKEFTFDAAHYLPGYDGPCQRMHGHTYRLQIGVQGLVNKESGMVVDFAKMKQWIKETIIDHLDHTCLNECKAPLFPTRLPTAENMVLWMRYILADAAAAKIPNAKAVVLIRLWETPTSYAEWVLE